MESNLTTPYVGEIEGVFNVPSYQRGYRWGKTEVETLLKDVYEHALKSERGETKAKYYLQPIVVCRNAEGGRDVADGQQRLTTLYLIYKYMHEVGGGLFPAPAFSLTYQTRKSSADFLQNISADKKDENIDFYYIYNAYRTICEWFSAYGNVKANVMFKLKTSFDERVKIILYEADEKDAESLFARLNIGRIPLSCAELVKAMFLSRGKETDEKELERIKAEQSEIALQWDIVESALHSSEFWYFLTTRSPSEYPTRIDLVLDLIAGKYVANGKKAKDKYFTFNYFADEREKLKKDDKRLMEIWRENIYRTFLILKGWYESNSFYHKIGFLITSSAKPRTLADIYDKSRGLTKTEFEARLDGMIAENIKLNARKPEYYAKNPEEYRNYGDLSYENSNDCDKIKNLLLLFNVISVMKLNRSGLRFPFDKYSQLENAKWSLEHIHAQNSEGLKYIPEKLSWLSDRQEVIKELGLDDGLQADLESVNKNNVEAKFKDLSARIEAVLGADVSDMHRISNLALLDTGVNSALSSSPFASKRSKILQKEKSGDFIPYCTKMVFLKCFTDAETSQPYFWSESDRRAYVNEINRVLAEYLEKPIKIPEEDRR